LRRAKRGLDGLNRLLAGVTARVSALDLQGTFSTARSTIL
jgi:hypothetical protein